MVRGQIQAHPLPTLIISTHHQRGQAALFYLSGNNSLENHIMTMYQRNRIKEEIDRQKAAADAGADRLLDKLKASKWTAAILLASAVILIVILWSLF